MTPYTWSRCATRRAGVRSEPPFSPAYPSSLPPPPPQASDEFWWSADSDGAVCCEGFFGIIITGKKGHWVQATKPFSLRVNASANQSVLCPPAVHGGGVNQQEWRGAPWEGEQTPSEWEIRSSLPSGCFVFIYSLTRFVSRHSNPGSSAKATLWSSPLWRISWPWGHLLAFIESRFFFMTVLEISAQTQFHRSGMQSLTISSILDHWERKAVSHIEPEIGEPGWEVRRWMAPERLWETKWNITVGLCTDGPSRQHISNLTHAPWLSLSHLREEASRQMNKTLVIAWKCTNLSPTPFSVNRFHFSFSRLLPRPSQAPASPASVTGPGTCPQSAQLAG